MNKETMQESSIPAQCRVSIVTLASLAKYWKQNGYNIMTVSQLMSWSLYLLVEILESNNQIDKEPSIREAREYMMNEGLYQKSMGDKGYKKLNAAIRFQGLREEGINPANSYVREDRNISHMLHRAPNRFNGKPSSVEPFTGKVYNEKVREAMEIMNNLPENTDSSLLDELSGIDPHSRKRENLESLDSSMEERFRKIGEDDKKLTEELNSLDLKELMSKAVKEEKIV